MTHERKKLTGAPLRASEKRNSGPEPAAATTPAPAIPIIIATRASAQNHAEAALGALAALMQSASSEHVRVAAANAILDRALGKPLTGKAAAEDLAEDQNEEPVELDLRWIDPDSL